MHNQILNIFPTFAKKVTKYQYFQFNTVEEILKQLAHSNDDWCKSLVKLLQTKSPTSLKITLRELRNGAKLNFDECMKMEYRIVNRILLAHDFYEGVRAVVIDKDNQPQWNPKELAAVDNSLIDNYFMPLEEELRFN